MASPSELWQDICGHMIRMNDKIERARNSITHSEWFETGPSAYGIEQLQAARNDLDRIIKICSTRREQVLEDETDTILYGAEHSPEAADRQHKDPHLPPQAHYGPFNSY